MLGLPHSVWREQPWNDREVDFEIDAAREKIGAYDHVFTHFALTQQVWLIRADESQFVELLRLHNSWQGVPLTREADLPTVFRKAFRLLPGKLPRVS